MVRVVQSLVVYVAGPSITTTAFTSTYPQFLAWFVLVNRWWSRTFYHYHSLHLHISSAPSMVRVTQSLVVYVAGPAIITTAFTSTYPQFLPWFVLFNRWWSM
jgi:hypothetical protein